MGYNTFFSGGVVLYPPLSDELTEEINTFCEQRHDEGSTPGIWCDWTVSSDGRTIIWNESEKFYSADLWMVYLIDHFIAPNGHEANGEIHADGEASDDFWMLVVENNNVYIRNGRQDYDPPIWIGGSGSTAISTPAPAEDTPEDEDVAL